MGLADSLKATVRAQLHPILVCLLVGLFLFDLTTPRGTGEWVLYLIPLLLTQWSRHRRVLVAVATAISVLVLLGAQFSPPGLSPEVAYLNRSLGILVIWAATYLLMRMRKERALELELQEAEARYRALRRRAEARLRRHEQEQEIILDSVPAMIWYKDRENRILRANKAAAESLGLRVEEVEGRSTGELYPGEAAKYHEDDLEVIRTGKPKLGIIEPYQPAAGEKRWVRTDKVPYRDERGTVVGVIVFAVDITERIRAEQALREAQATLEQRVEEESATRTRAEAALEASQEQVLQLQRLEVSGQLAGGIAHAFNNLLTIILGQGRLLQDALDPKAALYQQMAELLQAAKQAAGLTQHLLAFSRKQPRQPRLLDLNEMVTTLLPVLRPLLGDRVQLTATLAPSVGTVLADPAQIEQILVNLCLNARDAMPDGGTVTLRTADVVAEPAAVEKHLRSNPGDSVLLAVADTGVGMDEFVQAHCFEPFFTTRPTGQASGLGLSAVYGIVTQNDGRITVESQPGQGTTFWVYLPRVSTPVEAPRVARAPEEAPRGTETVLLVEDEAVIRTLLWRVLVSQGYKVLEAASGQEAIEQAARHRDVVHLLVTDLVMTGMSGLELARVLGESRPEMRTLYISGTTDVATLQELGLPLDADFLPKPFEPDELVRTVREVLDAPRHGA